MLAHHSRRRRVFPQPAKTQSKRLTPRINLITALG